MWLPKSFDTKHKILDLSSSGQSTVSVHELYADNVRVSNGIELNNWGDDPIQLFVCESCAIVQCKSGDWGTLRKAGAYIILMPSFHEMLQGDWEFEELSPPNFMKQYGAMLTTLDQYNELHQFMPAMPSVEKIKRLNSAEAARLMQWEAPQGVLGRFSDPIEFQEDMLLATNQVSGSITTNRLRRLLNDAIHSGEPVELLPISDETTVTSFFLDGIHYVEWQPMCLFEDSWQLVLKPGYRITRTIDGNS